MAYIGKQPVVGNFQVCDAISVVNGQAAYTMQVGSANVEPENANHMLVSLNGVLQKPGSSFTISGATITFASNLVTNDVIDFIILLGDTLSVGTPSDDSVGAAQIKADLISGTTALAAAPDDTDELLVSDAGTLKRIDYSLIKTVNTPAFIAYRGTSVQSLSDETETTVVFNTTDKNVGSCYDTSNGRFTPDVAGTYFLQFGFNPTRSASNAIKNYRVRIYKNGSTKQLHYEYEKTGGTFINRSGFMGSTTVVADGSDDYFTVAVYVDVSSGTVEIAATRHDTFFCGFKIIE